MVTQCSYFTKARKNRDIYLLRFIAVASGGVKTDLNLNNIIATLSTSVKNSPANATEMSAAIFTSIPFLDVNVSV